MEAIASVSPGTSKNAWEAVEDFQRRGWKVVPVDRGKGSTVPHRSGYVPRKEDFTGNIGLLVGDISGGIADVDADCPEAEYAAKKLLPPTSRFGRGGQVRHHLYVSPGCGSRTFKDVDGSVLVELRANTKGDGEPHLTVVPPGTHRTGQSIEWTNDLEPSRMEAHELRSAAGRVAAAALIACHLPASGRHDLALAFAGFMLKNLTERGMDTTDAYEWVYGVLEAAWELQADAPHEAFKDLTTGIQTTIEKIEADEPFTQKTALENELEHGATIVKRLQDWFGWGDLTPAEREAADQRQRQKRADKAIADPKVSELAHDRDILTRVYKIMQDGGLVGEEKNAKLVTLTTATMHTGRPQSLLLNDNSSTGKSYLLKQVIKTLPEWMVYEVQSVSNQGLAYLGETTLKGRFFCPYELGGLGNKESDSLEQIKGLITEGSIVRDSVKDHAAQKLRVEGPTGVLTTSTKLFMDHELSTRMFRISMTNTPEHRRAVLKARIKRNTSNADYSPIQGLHTYLAGQDHRVVVPFEDELTDRVNVASERILRDHERLMDLIEAHALLHQETRERDQDGCIVATLDDYEAVHDLIADIVGEASEVAVSETVRETVETVEALIRDGEEITRNTLADRLGIVPTSAGRRFGPATAQGFVREDPDNPNQKPKRYVLGNVPLPENSEVIPSPDVLRDAIQRSCVRASNSGSEHASDKKRVQDDGSNARSDARMRARSSDSVSEREEKSFISGDYGVHHEDETTPNALPAEQTHGRTMLENATRVAENEHTVHASVHNIVRPGFDPAALAHDFRDAMADGLIWNTGTTRERVAAYHGTLEPAEVDAVVAALAEAA